MLHTELSYLKITAIHDSILGKGIIIPTEKNGEIGVMYRCIMMLK
jgi:hypothetical protein